MAGRFKFVAIGVIALGLAMGVAFGLGVAYGQGDEKKAEGGITLAQIQQMIGGGGGGGGAGGAGAGGAGAGGAGAGGAGAGGAGAGGAGAGGAGANNAAAALAARNTGGRITAVQGQTVTIEIRPGVTQKLNLVTASVVNKMDKGSGADLKEGSSVLVSGTRKDDGSFDVATINIVAPEISSIFTSIAPAQAAGGAPAAATPSAPAPQAPQGAPAAPGR